jgi:hypothetical protein
MPFISRKTRFIRRALHDVEISEFLLVAWLERVISTEAIRII